jgi:hypothetical protein
MHRGGTWRRWALRLGLDVAGLFMLIQLVPWGASKNRT